MIPATAMSDPRTLEIITEVRVGRYTATSNVGSTKNRKIAPDSELRVAVKMPLSMKDPTPTKLRMLMRAIPQMPCPVVQPLPSLVPMPTRKPPMR